MCKHFLWQRRALSSRFDSMLWQRCLDINSDVSLSVLNWMLLFITWQHAECWKTVVFLYHQFKHWPETQWISLSKHIESSSWLISMCPPTTESDSELSLSGFETVASRSFDEDEEEDEGSVMLSSPCSSPTSMLQEDHHGDKDGAQPNGITKHRSAAVLLFWMDRWHPPLTHTHTPGLLSTPHHEMNKPDKGLASSCRVCYCVSFFASVSCNPDILVQVCVSVPKPARSVFSMIFVFVFSCPPSGLFHFIVWII